MTRRIALWAALVAGTALAFGALVGATTSSAAPLGRLPGSAPAVHVPQLLGLSRDRARARLRARHLRPAFTGIGKVVREDPHAGTLVHRGATVGVTLNLPRHGHDTAAIAAVEPTRPAGKGVHVPLPPLLVALGIATALGAEVGLGRWRREGFRALADPARDAGTRRHTRAA